MINIKVNRKDNKVNVTPFCLLCFCKVPFRYICKKNTFILKLVIELLNI